MFLASIILEHRFGWLFASLVIIVFAYPLAVLDKHGVTIVNSVEALVVLAAVATSARTRRELIQLAAVGCLAMVTDWANDFVWARQSLTSLLENFLYAIFFLRVAAIVLNHVFTPSRVTANEILGACSVYLILGMVWARLFHIEAVLAPGSFRGLEESGNEAVQQSDLLYFSMTTLTTSGIGDIVPVNRVARMLTAVEAVFGQLYLVVLVGRFVGLHIAHSPGNPRKSTVGVAANDEQFENSNGL